jgi:hypothetical protein
MLTGCGRRCCGRYRSDIHVLHAIISKSRLPLAVLWSEKDYRGIRQYGTDIDSPSRGPHVVSESELKAIAVKSRRCRFGHCLLNVGVPGVYLMTGTCAYRQSSWILIFDPGMFDRGGCMWECYSCGCCQVDVQLLWRVGT